MWWWIFWHLWHEPEHIFVSIWIKWVCLELKYFELWYVTVCIINM